MRIATKYNKNTELQSWSYPLGQAANLHIMLSHENCNYFEQVVPYKNHEHAAKSFIRTDNLGFVSPNPEPGLGIEIDWDVVNRDWYSHIRLDEKVHISEKAWRSPGSRMLSRKEPRFLLKNYSKG